MSILTPTQTLIAAVLVATATGSASGQAPDAVRIANPEAIECRFTADRTPVPSTRYEVEIFRMADRSLTAPVKAFELAGLERAGADTVRLRLKGSIEDLPEGEYVATVRTVVGVQPGPRSAPTDAFTVFNAATAGSVPFLESSPEQRRSERFWTRVAIGVAAGLIALPLLLR